jgi:hypothetical protein
VCSPSASVPSCIIHAQSRDERCSIDVGREKEDGAWVNTSAPLIRLRRNRKVIPLSGYSMQVVADMMSAAMIAPQCDPIRSSLLIRIYFYHPGHKLGLNVKGIHTNTINQQAVETSRRNLIEYGAQHEVASRQSCQSKYYVVLLESSGSVSHTRVVPG